MRARLPIALVCALGPRLGVAAPAAPAAPEKPAALVARVQAAYHGAADMEARFEQTYVDRLRHRRRVESGRLWADARGRVRWSYLAPQRKEFVFDGDTAYFYEPDSAQVTVFAHFADSPVAQASQFLWGRGDLRDGFELTFCADPAPACPAVAPPLVALRARPKQPLAAVDTVTLVLDRERGRVVAATVLDPLGNRTEYAFADVRFDVGVDPRRFSFTVPPGVSTLQAAGDAPPPPARPPGLRGAPPG